MPKKEYDPSVDWRLDKNGEYKHYTKDINYIVTLQDVEVLISRATNVRDKALVAFMYITGARPYEISKVEHDDIFMEGVNTLIRIPTAKLGSNADRKFTTKKRTLAFRPDTPFLEYIHMYRHSVKPIAELQASQPYIFPITPDWMKKIIYKLSNNVLCPYHFRHTRLLKLSREGATADELMAWKGSADIRSVSEYLRDKPIDREFDIK